MLGALLATDLSDAELRDQVVSLIAAGYETTSGAAAFAVLELLRHPAEWKRVAEEIDSLTTIDDARGGVYVAAVVNETLRLWPPPFAGRYTTEPCSFRGYDIPAGSTIVFSPYVTGRDPALWGPDACIGFGLALTEMRVVVTRIVQRMTLRLVDPDAVVRGTGVASTRPDGGVRVVVESVR